MDSKLQSNNPSADPAITSVVDGTGTSLGNPGITEDLELTLSGTAPASTLVIVVDNDTEPGYRVLVDAGEWKLDKLPVAVGLHSFTVQLPNGLPSLAWIIDIKDASLQLPPAIVDQAPAGVLDPLDAINGASVIVTYAMQPGDTIGLSWNGFDNLVPTQPGDASNTVVFTTPAAAVAAAIGKTIPVIYGVIRSGVAKPSQVLSLTVKTLADSILEAPKIVQAPDDLTLDVGALSGDVDLTVKPWPLIAAGQQISLRFEGTKADGSPYCWLHPTWQKLPINSDGMPTTTVALTDLKELGDGSSLTLIFEVSFDDGVSTVVFPKRTLTISAKKFASGFENWQTTGACVFALNVPLRSPSGLVTTLIKDSGGYITYIFNYAGTGEMALRVATDDTVKFEFGGWINRLGFTHYWGGSNNWVNFYDDKHNLIHVHEIVGQGVADIVLPRPCLWCWIAVYNADTGLAVDNISWS